MKLLSNRAFVYGVVAGIIGVYVWHHYVQPLPGTGASPAAGKHAARKARKSQGG